MANRNNVPNPVLPLAPLEYDVQYVNNLVRLLNYFIEQQANPGAIRGTSLALTDGSPATFVQIAPGAIVPNKTQVVLLNLPTSASGLAKGTVWNDSGTLKIIP